MRTFIIQTIITVANDKEAIWSFMRNTYAQVLQNRVGRFYLGVHKFTPVAETQILMD